MITGLNKKSGLLDTAPLHKFISDFFAERNNTLYRRLSLGSVDANTGNYIVWNESSPDPMKSVLASAAIPMVFPDVKWTDPEYTLIDGGSVYNTNLVSAV